MTYNFTFIKSKLDCETLINIATQAKEDLEFRKLSLERQRKTTTMTSVEVETEIQSVTAEIAGLETYIATLPEGKSKEESVFKRKKLEYKLLLLSQRKNNYGVVALIEKEFDIGCIDKQLEETSSFINAVTQYMNSL
jgi:hypothetical protein